MFQQGPNLTLELEHSSRKETHVVTNLTLDCILYSSSVADTLRMIMPNLDLLEMKTDYSVVLR